MAETVACSCGAIVPEDELEAHMAGHGIASDTYAGAKVRKFLEEHEERGARPVPEADEGESRGQDEA